MRAVLETLLRTRHRGLLRAVATDLIAAIARFGGTRGEAECADYDKECAGKIYVARKVHLSCAHASLGAGLIVHTFRTECFLQEASCFRRFMQVLRETLPPDCEWMLRQF